MTKVAYNAALFLTLLSVVKVASACTCVPTTLKNAYYSPQTERFVRATPVFKGNLGSGSFNNVYYILNVQTDYKGCKRTSVVQVCTSASSASCGVEFQLHTSYVLPLDSFTFPVINSCQFIRPYASLVKEDKDFLNSRQLCCKGSCVCTNGQPPVSCFVEPCRVSRKPCSAAVRCENNYCGGCFAEWFNQEGTPACMSGNPGFPSDLTSA